MEQKYFCTTAHYQNIDMHTNHHYYRKMQNINELKWPFCVPCAIRGLKQVHGGTCFKFQQ